LKERKDHSCAEHSQNTKGLQTGQPLRGISLQQVFGAAERERFLAMKEVVARTERGLGAEARAGSVRKEVRW